MPELLERLLRLFRTPHGKKLFRYTMVSVISTAVSLGTLELVFGVFRLWSEVPSTLFANLVATVPSYYLNRSWAWGKSGRSHLWKEVLPFWVLAVIGWTLSIATSAAAHSFSVNHHFGHDLRTLVVEAANIAAFGVLWIGKFLIFNRMFHIGPMADDTEDEVEARLSA
ncbi:MAG: GtrA family protein [Acidimicrobiales bacterium]